MVTSKETMLKIKRIIEKHHKQLTISTLGRDAFTPEELAVFETMGIDTTNDESFLEMTYMHNWINNPLKAESPTSIGDMIMQQKGYDLSGDVNAYTIDALNQKAKDYIERMTLDVATRIMGVVHENNDAYKFDALQNLDRDSVVDDLARESSLSKVKQKLRDTSGVATRDWNRVALTEMSNAIGIGSVDRITADNKGADLSEVYCYRVIVGDAATCVHCRKFYGDVGEIPKIYKLTTLLGNGSNYGKPQSDWRPICGATHPNTRTSQIIELKPGFAVQPGGTMTYIGMDKWPDWVHENLEG